MHPTTALWFADEGPSWTPSKDHDRCNRARMRLIHARAELWRTGRVPSWLLPLWEEARRTVPDWPGWRRLEPTEHWLQLLNAARSKTGKTMRWLRREREAWEREQLPP